ncbi:hypothetical protein [Telmatospirillum siberiense]|uniref:Uncharacterized protein n=1 Tax=Telmatospirillum siberiense TaxID=382514 RepID=A0A2N3PTK9_9PROT|nr:hypothetical protein [Telmatospirillum siberiense]PKU23734.1 hypothetical protein CWS72_14650 [Telmatospirillum siberiense]
MQHSSNLILGELKLPFDEGGDAELIERRDFKFRFAYREIPFFAHFRADASRIEVSGDVGPMPFSAESSLARIELQTVLDAANAHLGETFLIREGRIGLVGGASVSLPVTAVGLITALTLLLIKLRPYLETIEVFLLPPGEARASGETALRPGWRGIGVKRHAQR